MTNRHRYLLIVFVFAVLSAVVAAYSLRNRNVPLEQCSPIARVAKIRPDYCGTVIPPNIAPLNFLVQEDGIQYCVRIRSGQGKPIEVFSKNARIIIPQKRWHKLLDENKGEELYFDVFVKTEDNRWIQFETITNKIAQEPIDSFMVYRKIYPVHGSWSKMGIYQRNLHNFDELPILDNRYLGFECFNCHTFCNNQPGKMLIGIRSSDYGSGTLLAEDGMVSKVGTNFGYSSWHPSGRLAAYSINNVRQFFHTASGEVRDVVDLDSLLAYYMVDSKTVRTVPQLSRKDRLETYPAWSPDGRYLYFSSAAMLWSDREKVPPEHWDKVRYDLMRISYEVESDTWGQLETVLSSEDTGLSILEPRVSPDGRWLLFCMCEYGCFPVYQPSSDLHIMDLSTGRYERLACNSDQSESWHCWSSNSRWIVFSSKRDYGVFTRSYFSYIDGQGGASKAFLLPQKDPGFYDWCLKTYSVPELVTGPVRTAGEQLGRVVRSSRQIGVDMPITMATPEAGGLPSHDEPWQQRE